MTWHGCRLSYIYGAKGKRKASAYERGARRREQGHRHRDMQQGEALQKHAVFRMGAGTGAVQLQKRKTEKRGDREKNPRKQRAAEDDAR